jgi:hypothetical protein
MRLTFRKTLIAFLMMLVGLSVLGCKEKTTVLTGTNGAVIPQLSNPDAIFFQGANYGVTYNDVYEEFKSNDGINQLLFMVDAVLFESYITSVTAEEIVNKIKVLKYNTDDDTKIAAFSEDELADAEEVYNQNMLLLGYAADPEVYVRMVVAKEKFAAAQMKDIANKDKSWYVGESTIATYYTNTYFEDLSAIKIRFYGETDAKNVMRALNLVSLNGTLRRYTGTKPIEEVASSSFNETNTAVLTNDELVVAFIQMYNLVYGTYRSTVSEAANLQSLKEIDDLKHNYIETRDTQLNLAKFMFQTLASYEEAVAGTAKSLFYTYAPVKYAGANDSSYYMILKLDGNDKVDLSSFNAETQDLATLIGADVYAKIEQTMIRKNLETTGFVSERIANYRTLKNFELYDYYLGIDYKAIDTTYELNEIGDERLVASFDGHSITADELLTFALNKNGALYVLYAAQMAVVMDRHFADVYCVGQTTCQFDLSKNSSTKLTDHATTLAQLKKSFEASYYIYYYTFEEYIYLAYGAKSEQEMIGKYYVKSTLQPYVIYDEITKNNWTLLADYLYDLISDYYDNYFSLKVEYLKIYVDRDENGAADNYDDFLNALVDTTAHETLLAGFETAIRTYLETSTNTYTSLISAYNKAKRDDATWGLYKQYGFHLMTENLNELTYLTTVNKFQDSLIEGFANAYDEYRLEANVAKASHYYSQLVQAKEGMFLLLVKPGTNFEKPSAKFEMTYDNDNKPLYTVGIENENAKPTLEQLKIYAEYRFYEIVYGTGSTVGQTYGITVPVIPTSVTTAIEAYFTDLHDSMYVVGFLNIIIADDLITGNFVNSISAYCNLSDAEIKAALLAIRGIYFDQVFSGYDTLD